MADNTVFDSVFKTMVHKTPQLVIPFINEAFGRSYPADAPIVQFNSEHEEPQGPRIADSVFRLGDKIYHIECQSTPDSNMVVRMIEYDFAIALEQAIAAGAPYEMDFPESCVLFLRDTANTPDELRLKVNLPGGGSFDYTASVVKAQRFGIEEIFEKRLLLLLPYYLMRYEGALSAIAADDARTDGLIAECAELRAGLETATLGKGEALLYEELVELIIRVIDHIMAAHEVLRKKVRRTMGGEVLELMHERAERLAREAEQRGIELGLERGIEQGIEQGRELGVELGIEQGRELGIEQGRELGIEQGREQGVELGRKQGIELGRVQGIELGVEQGFDILANVLRGRGFDES
ncbi:MAG: hypothetical protein IJ087_17020, partial [Eggerthellaceae bacterium]|nr:hypothetical protein [Eggerthellaceae bacterium]